MSPTLEQMHFAILTHQALDFSNAALIYVTTNNPCHLFLHHTIIAPKRHRTSRTLRGDTFPWGAYWCFSAFTPVEQREAGDTLTHTFIVYPWQQDQKKYYVIAGTVSTIQSPSSSPILEHTRSWQRFILNPFFLDWSAPDGDAPDHWPYLPAPHHDRWYPDSTYSTIFGISCRGDNPAPFGAMRLQQYLSITHLSNLRLTFDLDYRGAHHFLNTLFVRADGDWTALDRARPTLNYQWETLSVRLTMPSNLTSLLLEANNNNQGFPTPFQTWYDNARISYTPP